jgi:hypothetical protein
LPRVSSRGGLRFRLLPRAEDFDQTQLAVLLADHMGRASRHRHARDRDSAPVEIDASAFERDGIEQDERRLGAGFARAHARKLEADVAHQQLHPAAARFQVHGKSCFE